MTDHGLGAIESPPDQRDWPLALPPLAVPLPRRFVSAGMGPVLNQGSLPQCVAYSHAGLKTWEEKRDGGGVIAWDTSWLYGRCKAIDNIAGEGTDCRSALRVLKGTGCKPSSGNRPAALYKVAAYYAVPTTLDAIKQALVAYGPVTVGGAWYSSWFRPVKGILPAAGGGIAGGHAVLVFGWDDDVAGGSLLVRNSWGKAWPGSTNGNFYGPYSRYLPTLWEAWKARDQVT